MNGHLNGERCVFHECVISIGGEDKLGSWHVSRRNNMAHWNRVAASSLDLLTIGQRDLLCQTEVYEVVVGRERRDCNTDVSGITSTVKRSKLTLSS